MGAFASTRILGVRVDKVTKQQALQAFREMLHSPSCSLIVTPNAEIVEKADKTPAEGKSTAKRGRRTAKA